MENTKPIEQIPETSETATETVSENIETPEVVEEAVPESVETSKTGAEIVEGATEETLEETAKNTPATLEQSSEVLSEAVDNAEKEITNEIEEKAEKGLKSSKISGHGKLAIGLMIGAAIISGRNSRKRGTNNEAPIESEEEKRRALMMQQRQGYTNMSFGYMGGSYEQELAKDISSYQYGKHIHGFVNA